MKQQSIYLIGFLCLSLCSFSQTFTLKSPALGGQMTSKQVFNRFGCTGTNKSPQLNWEHPPEGTKSFAVTMYDPDAPTGSGWWHWLVFDIPATVKELKSGAGNPKSNALPGNAIQSITDYGTHGYGGPCPPEGDPAHRYIITVYALKTEKLGLEENASPALVGYYLNANAIQKSSVMAYFQR